MLSQPCLSHENEVFGIGPNCFVKWTFETQRRIIKPVKIRVSLCKASFCSDSSNAGRALNRGTIRLLRGLLKPTDKFFIHSLFKLRYWHFTLPTFVLILRRSYNTE